VTQKKYNHTIRRITCPICKVSDLSVRETGRVREHAPGHRGLTAENPRAPLFSGERRHRSEARCRAGGKTEEEAIAMSEGKSEPTVVSIPGVTSHTHDLVIVVRGDKRYEARMDSYEMEDGSRKILVVGPQPYIEIIIPKRTGP
jgi:hypothetical protein